MFYSVIINRIPMARTFKAEGYRPFLECLRYRNAIGENCIWRYAHPALTKVYWRIFTLF